MAYRVHVTQRESTGRIARGRDHDETDVSLANGSLDIVDGAQAALRLSEQFVQTGLVHGSLALIDGLDFSRIVVDPDHRQPLGRETRRQWRAQLSQANHARSYAHAPALAVRHRCHPKCCSIERVNREGSQFQGQLFTYSYFTYSGMR